MFLPPVGRKTHLFLFMTVCPSENRQAVSPRLIVIVPVAKVVKPERVRTMTTCAAPKKSVCPEGANARLITRNVGVGVTRRVVMD